MFGSMCSDPPYGGHRQLRMSPIDDTVTESRRQTEPIPSWEHTASTFLHQFPCVDSRTLEVLMGTALDRQGDRNALRAWFVCEGQNNLEKKRKKEKRKKRRSYFCIATQTVCPVVTLFLRLSTAVSHRKLMTKMSRREKHSSFDSGKNVTVSGT